MAINKKTHTPISKKGSLEGVDKLKPVTKTIDSNKTEQSKTKTENKK